MDKKESRRKKELVVAKDQGLTMNNVYFIDEVPSVNLWIPVIGDNVYRYDGSTFKLFGQVIGRYQKQHWPCSRC